MVNLAGEFNMTYVSVKPIPQQNGQNSSHPKPPNLPLPNKIHQNSAPKIHPTPNSATKKKKELSLQSTPYPTKKDTNQQKSKAFSHQKSTKTAPSSPKNWFVLVGKKRIPQHTVRQNSPPKKNAPPKKDQQNNHKN